MRVAVSNQVKARNGIGQFIKEVEAAATFSVQDAIDEGADLSRAMAPAGSKTDPRTTKLKASISSRMTSRTSGVWEASARHALPIEFGAAPHDISGRVSFFWESQGRWWIPGDNIIQHPGNAAQPYLRPAYAIVSRKMMSIMKKHYPG